MYVFFLPQSFKFMFILFFLGSGFFGMFMLLCGFFVRASNIPNYWIWFHYIDFYKVKILLFFFLSYFFSFFSHNFISIFHLLLLLFH